MGEETLSVPLRLNSAGDMSQECPSCERTFKIQPGKGSPLPISHCPYCDHQGQGCWLTKAQAQYLGAYGAHKILRPSLEKMVRDLNRANRGGLITVSASLKGPSSPPQAPPEEEDAMPTVHFECCGETIRHDGENAQLHCPICGAVRSA